LALTWNDIDFEKNCISITKSISVTKADRRIVKGPKTKAGFRCVPLPSVCFDILCEWKEEQKEQCREHGTAWKGEPLRQFDMNYIFTQINGKPMDSNTPYHKFKEIRDYYNSTVTPDKQLPDITLHDLRHTSASLLIANNVDIETIARRLGHSNVAITLNRYGHALPSQEEKAVNALQTMLNIQTEKSDIAEIKDMA